MAEGTQLPTTYISPRQFGLFRIFFGTYMAVHFLLLIGHSKEIYSDHGIFPDASLNISYGYFPNPLYLWDQPVVAAAFPTVGFILSLFLILGIKRRIVGLAIWFIMACLFHRNNFTENPSLYYSGWTLLCFTLVPAGEGYTLKRIENKDWEFPPLLFHGAWIIMGLSYSVSGIDKFINSESWRTGYAILLVAESSFAKPWFFLDFFLSLPTIILKLVNWGSLAAEVLFLPLMLLSRWTRFLAWLGMALVHTGVLAILWVPDLTVGMLLFHFFTFDHRWKSSIVNSPLYRHWKALATHLLVAFNMNGKEEKPIDA